MISAWRDHVDERKLDSLPLLAQTPPETLIEILGNKQRVPGRAAHRPLKAEAVRKVANSLVDVGVHDTVGLRDALGKDEKRVRAAFTAINGVGEVTFSYFLMLLGFEDVKADRMIRRFVADALDQSDAPSATARKLVREVARRLDVKPQDLDHAIWQWQRRRRRK